MYFGKNLVFLRQMHNRMTQEELAEKMGVSRQTISKWELDDGYPEMNKVIDLCNFFSCSMDDLMRNDMNIGDEAYSNIRIEEIEAFKYLRYAVVSMEPEEDAINHIKSWAALYGIDSPNIIGWDFPILSQEQINVFHMHGYTAAWILPKDIVIDDKKAEIVEQKTHKYVAVTIKEPMTSPFTLIPNAYKMLMSHIQVNRLRTKEPEGVIPCYEREYVHQGATYMDIYIAVNG